MTLTDDFAMVFGDGTLTGDIATVLNEGVEASKAKNPDEWGHWRKNGEDYEYKWSYEDEFDTPVTSFKVEPGANGQLLDGCFSHMTQAGNTGLGGHDIATGVSTFCFNPRGQFSHGSAVSVSGEDYAGGGSSPKETGRYQINGNVITFTYNDGRVVHAGFGFLSDDHEHILINSTRYF